MLSPLAAAGAGRVILLRRTVNAAEGEFVGIAIGGDDAGGPPARDAVRRISSAEGGARGILDRLVAGEVVTVAAGEVPEAFAPVVGGEGSGSLRLVPVFSAGTFWGALGFAASRDAREWSGVEREALRAVAGWLGAAVERAVAEDEERTSDERTRRAERMDALGWLAAGLARDFDAVMTSIRGYGERALARLRPGDPIRADVSEMLLAGERAAEMTRELASLGRRQPARPVRFELSAWLAGRLPLLRRLVGDDIEIDVAAAPLAAPLEVDPDLLEQAIVTFVLDARERLSAGGRVELHCELLAGEPLRRRGLLEALGPQAACIGVHDDGPPLAAEVASRLFEPFSGGHAPARGGLGLAAAYGIVRQCGGMVLLARSDDEGTLYEILLPTAADEPAVEAASGALAAASGGPPTVLLVEDEDLIRDLAEQILAEAGYRVFAAADASEAMALAEQVATPIDLLLTDVVMPGVSGADLAHRLLRQHPEMRILYMSGYSDSLIFRYGVLQERAAFLRKPFSAEVLEQRVAELLGQGGSAAPPTSPRRV